MLSVNLLQLPTKVLNIIHHTGFSTANHKTGIGQDRRSQTSYTAPHNGVLSHGAPIGGRHTRVFADHTHLSKCKENASTILAHHAEFHVSLPSRSDRSRCRWHSHLTNHGYFDHRKSLNSPNWSPMPGGKWPWFLNLYLQITAIKLCKAGPRGRATLLVYPLSWLLLITTIH